MPLWQSILLFGIPGAMIYLGTYYGVPYLDNLGVPLIVSWTLFMMGPIALLIPASIIAYRLEGNPMNWSAFKKRFRLNSISGKVWLLILAIFLIAEAGKLGLQFTGKILAQIPIFAPPSILPELMNPEMLLTKLPSTFFGIPVLGNFWLILFWLVWLFFNIFGEEFMWRGYMLPRMELTYGKWAWLVNGLLWCFLLHAFMSFYFIAMLPLCLLTPWLAQKTKNTWPAFLVHLFGNMMMLFVIVPGVVNG